MRSFLVKSDMAYEYSFASVYDKFTEDVNYGERAEYICTLLRENGIESGILLDAACGTGSLSEIFLKKGFEVIANDISYEMLNIAREKLSSFGDKVLLMCQDMCELDLYGTVDCAVCSLDSINHLLLEEDVNAAFESIGRFIRPGGIFIFDVNTVYKHREILSDRTFVYEDDTSVLVWQNSECDETDTVEMYIDIFSKKENGMYSRMSDCVTERAYSVDAISQMLQSNGFEILNIYGDTDFSAPKDDEERIYFLARKK